MSQLRPYQIEGAYRLANLTCGVLADEMGLGKSGQALTAMGKSGLVVSPSIAKGVWAREAKLWRPDLKPVILSGMGSFRWPQENELVITNYDILPDSPRAIRKRREQGKSIDPKSMMPVNTPRGITIIGDEAHYCKSNKAERTQAMRQLTKHVTMNGGKSWALTGTPIKNSPMDLYHIFNTFGLIPYTFKSFPNFIKLMGGHKSGFDYIWDGPTDYARTILDNFMIRRTRAEVLPEIPKESQAIIPVELSSVDKSEVERIISDAGWTVEQITADTLHQFLANEHMMRARACLASAKVKAAMEWCDEAEACGEPVVVFSAHRDAVKKIGSRPGWAIISGDTSSAERTRIEDAFQRGELRGVSANIQAGGVAITLTRAALMLMVDKMFTNADNRQAMDRINRIGQTRPVTIYSLVADHPLDERIHEILEIKANDAEIILNDSARKPKTTDEIFASL